MRQQAVIHEAELAELPVDIERLTRAERESLRAAATRNLVECCDQCRDLLRAQLQAEENRASDSTQE